MHVSDLAEHTGTFQQPNTLAYAGIIFVTVFPLKTARNRFYPQTAFERRGLREDVVADARGRFVMAHLAVRGVKRASRRRPKDCAKAPALTAVFRIIVLASATFAPLSQHLGGFVKLASLPSDSIHRSSQINKPNQTNKERL
jgi:hypothetical protein